MQRKLTVTLDETVYHALYRIIGRGNISHFIETLLRRYFSLSKEKQNLEAAYRQMAQDEEREAQAFEWTEAIIGDMEYEKRGDLVGQF